MILSVTDTLRTLFAFLCEAIYPIIAFAYNLFFEIASFKLLSSDGVKEIYRRVTVILAIIMFFYIVFEFVKYVVEPDAMTDKEKGVQKLGFRLVGVILLMAFVPTIFNLAYDLEHSLIANGVISKVILGKTLSDPIYAGRQFSVAVLDTFYYYDGDDTKSCGNGIQCDGIVKLNKATLINDGKLPYMTMGINGLPSASQNIPGAGNVKEYLIHFDAFFAVCVGAFLGYILIMYCVDVAVRSIQLVYLQIIAPIPIIGFLSPKKDNIFSKWVKQCTTTYLDIFIRISLIYFILLICRTILDNKVFENLGDASGFVKIALIMGLLLFAQKAPKMLQELFPKMGAASGNFGLKAGERVAPAAARAIGVGLGATRLLTGAIARGANTARRNRQERERTGKTRSEQREDIRANRSAMKEDRKAYKQAVSQRNKALRHKTYSTGSTAYDVAQKDIQKKRDAFVESQSKYADSQNTKYRSVALNALAGAAGGAYRGMKTGAGATKLEDIGKKVKEGYANDKKAVNAREQWLNTGGYSNVRRAVAGVEQSIGMTTPAGKTERDINVLDSQIKANERLIATESDVKAKEDSAKDRSGSKIEAGEQKTIISPVDAGDLDITGLDGKSKKPIELPPVEYDNSGNPLPTTTSSVYAHYKAKAESARANADAAAQVYQDLRAAKLRGEAVDDATLSKAENDAREAEKNATIASDEQGKVKKAMQEYAISRILDEKANDRDPRTDTQYDGVLVEKVEDALTSILETTRDKKTWDKFQEQIKGTKYAYLGPVYDELRRTGNTKLISDYKTLDDIQTVLINIANDRTRENVGLKGSKTRMETSSNYDAQKADDKASGGGSGK